MMVLGAERVGNREKGISQARELVGDIKMEKKEALLSKNSCHLKKVWTHSEVSRWAAEARD